MMDLRSFKYMLRGEDSVKRYLVKACWKNDVRFCIRCEARKVYWIRRDRYRCSRCGYEFSDFAGRWINKVKLPPREWLWLIKLFELEISARRASQQLGISYPTVHKAYHLIRRSIIAHSGNGDLLSDGEIEAKEPGFDGRSKAPRVENFKPGFPVFGILERKGSVKVEPLRDLSAEAVLNLAVKTARRGSIVYTDRWGRYDALMFCDYKHFADYGKRFSRGDVPMNGMEGFLSYAKERMNKFHGISKEKFPLYLKEMEFRYNHRRKPIFNTLVRYLCDLKAT
ncbi:MAG: Transposase-like protein [Deltaproteobacteria bacterium]|nr:Transposase-like protein [Deltaproteobacteria bacterium]